MNIDRYNYEEFFLLYTDNELNSEERAAVEAFAAAHPDLQEELDLLQQFRVVPDETGFPDIASLIRPEAGSFINEGNCEEKFLLYIDNELDATERGLVEAFVQQHPAVQPAFDLLRRSRLQPDAGVQFPDKQLLYRTEKEKVVPFGWWKMAAAAMVLLVAGALWLNNEQAAKQMAYTGAGKTAVPVLPPTVNEAGKEEGAQDPSSATSTAPEKAPEKAVSQEPVAAVDHAAGTRTARASGKTPAAAKVTRRAQRLPAEVDPVADLQGTRLVAQNKITPAAVETQKNIIDEAVSLNTHTGLADSNADSGISFASNNDAEDVYVSNIPIDKKHALRGLLRKASRVINKAAGLNGEKSILIGSVELALK